MLKRRAGGVVVPTGIRGRGTGSLQMRAPVTLKPPVGGLVVLDQPGVYSTAAMDNGINHIMFRLLWDAIEPTDTVPTLGVPTYNWGVVNQALNALPAGAYAKIGVGVQGPGLLAPQWLRDATGSVTVTNTKDGTVATCCHWWEDFPQTRWAMLQQAMAAQFDNDPRLKMVIACLHMANYMEPFILGSDSTSDHNLFLAGLDNPAGGVTSAASVSRMLDATLAAWKHTRVELPLHTTWEIPKATTPFINQQPWATLRDFINPYEQSYGQKIMFSDYGLGSTDTIPNTPGATLLTATTEYEWMRIRGFSGHGPVGFQITDPGNPNTQGVVNNADLMNGSYLEHSGYGGLFPTAQAMTDADRLLKDNAGI